MNKLTFLTAFALLLCMNIKAQQIEKCSKSGLKYLEYTPEIKSKTEKLPLLIFLHGSGERGDDLNKVKLHGPPSFLDERKDFPFLTISPQCPKDIYWNKDILLPFFKEIIRKYPVDKKRLYITGLSMGGYGTWETIIEKPGLFAAAAPICGGGDTTKLKRIKELPIWVFHGAKDNVVRITKSEEMVDALKALGSKVEFTVYPDAGHDSWTETYNNPKLYEWFLSKEKK